MDCNTLTALKTPYAGSLHNRCPYLPQDHVLIPLKPGTEQYAPTYPVAHNPLRYKRKEDFQTNISHAYKTPTSIAYTQSWDEYHKGLFSYYLYDHFGRPIETGQAKITHIRTGDHDKVQRMTDAHIREHVYSLSNRINVMVAIYDADPFPACSNLPQDHQYDKIATIYYYPSVHAATPRSEDGQYYPEGSWYAAEYHYNPNHSITTTCYQCTAQVQELPIAENSTAKQQQLPTTDPLPSATQQPPLAVAPVSRNYNCPVNTLHFDTLIRLHNQVFHVLYGHHQSSPPGSFAAGITSWATPTFYHQPYHPLNPFSNYSYQHSYNIYLTSNLHCRGATVSHNAPHHYCHSPPSLYIAAKARLHPHSRIQVAFSGSG